MNNNQNKSSSSNGFSNKRDQGLSPYFLGRPGNNFNPSGSAKDSKEQNGKSNVHMFERPNGSKASEYNPNNKRR